ncbi:hypothetical protein UNDYM_3971 [Undibacterium sp. YM2]|uniref:hypothetical protein n=1 Tax=Undibacterium sp. YM2 TaxID=2058625 RepID=UPI001331E525|nr:hypothetical protein [Undibacterium sp. YM2]BBB68224.1 hypothetical protein UNDYM_3971 [Undibacterium sp. YM2]
MIRSTYTGRDGLPYFFPVLDDEQDDAQGNMEVLSGSITGPQTDMTLTHSGGLSGWREADFWPQQDNFALAGSVDEIDDPLLLRASSQPGLALNSWQRSEVPGTSSWGRDYEQATPPVMRVSEQPQGEVSPTGYRDTVADVSPGRNTRLDLPPPGLTREQEATWMQRQLFQNRLGIDTRLLPDVDYAEFSRKGSKYYSQVPPELLRTIRGSMAHAITRTHFINRDECEQGDLGCSARRGLQLRLMP